MSDTPMYLEQLNRMIRWFKRFKQVSEGQTPSSLETFQDDIHAFFLNCYHLKDWILNDVSVSYLHPLVEPFITKSKSLSMCADLCNGMKHMKLTNPRSDQHPRIGSKIDKVILGLGDPIYSVGFLIVTDQGEFDAFGLAEDCIDEWKKFLYLNRQPA